jgi:hypothetical protein
MSVQIVISGNRVLAHGTDFSVTGDAVECASTGRIYQNATIATVDSVPDDIDSVGYEYHAGRFVPCGPFGKGSGNVAILCNDDCKALKDSGIPIGRFAQSERVTYRPTAGGGVSLSFNISPDVVFIAAGNSTNCCLGVIMYAGMYCIATSDAESPARFTGTVNRNGNTLSWNMSGDSGLHFQMPNITYTAYAFSM